ncbi:ABC transporter permease [Novilysobacter spongiicola]|uniref:ABC-2 type transport system permease protein n=1 Tax=Lysobacter spongiicola DSM 21749 TaxID=1122188 RepID=A0A1T4PER9_9GAMM|nr:ABC transporter permease [Lysobacter spongiicola]SJZ89841.1 ABC-2 type transport system permease protein [Lysobacter spongiicola DSM 21749]
MSEGFSSASIPVGARSSGAPGAFWRELKESFRNPEFWALSSWLDIIVRARKSRFGILWLLAPSVVYVFGLGLFFASMQPGGGSNSFYAYVALGAMVFRTLMSAVIGSATVFNGSHSFIMDGHMRLTDFLLQSLAKSFFDFCMYLPVVIVALVIADGISLTGLLWALPAVGLIYLNGLWISAVFSLAGARFPDFGQLLNTVSIFLFLLTPIIWYPEMMPAGSIRSLLMRLNPFYHFVEIFRAPILGDPVEVMSLWYVGIMTVAGLALATLVYRRYARFVPLWI